MGRSCSGYRDPVATMFRDESRGFAIKRQKLNKAKAVVANNVADKLRKSTEEIDQAFSACSIAFGKEVSPSACCDQTPLQWDHSRVRSESCFRLTGTLARQQKLSRRKAATASESHRKDVNDSLRDNLASLENTSSLLENGNTEEMQMECTTVQSAHCPRNQHFIDSLAFINWSQDLASQSSESDIQELLEIEDMFDFDSFAEPSVTLPNYLDDPHPNCDMNLMGLPDSADMQALCYFFANYVLDDTSSAKGYLNYLPTLCAKEGGNSFLMNAVTALGLVGLASKKHDQGTLNAARLKYASALRELNEALTSSDGTLSDQALTTVFLMGLYEVRSKFQRF
jgi:hypothetical protein